MTLQPLRVALAQLNTTVGDIDGNVRKICDAIARARDLGADVVAVPELAIIGYPPEDLLLRRSFIDDNLAALQRILPRCGGITAIVGFIDATDDIYNAAAIIHDGALIDVYHKHHLPNYGVFDENRYFQQGQRNQVYRIGGALVGVSICEDVWYPGDPLQAQALAGAQVSINLNASPYSMGKHAVREHMLATRATDHSVAVCYVNQVGGQDELVFDGGSMVLSERGERLAMARQFEEDLLVADIDVQAVLQTRLHDPRRRKEQAERGGPLDPPIAVSGPSGTPRPPLPPSDIAPLPDPDEAYAALVLGTRDYVRKNGFRKVIIGLSGGIDSSMVAAIAVDALGGENVLGVSMPSRYSSEGSISDSQRLAENLGMEFQVIPIEDGFTTMLKTMEPAFAGTEPNVAEENMQARLRGLVAMSIANKFGWMVLTTGNKSEMATGYATLYGDMAGGFAVIKDVPKTLVYRLAGHVNARAGREVIPESVLAKPPSAELRPNQIDEDSLPPYEVLDPILQAYVEEDRGFDEIVRMGYDAATVRRVIDLVNHSEYKRRQSPPCIKITPRAFGRDRRFPIASKYAGY